MQVEDFVQVDALLHRTEHHALADEAEIWLDCPQFVNRFLVLDRLPRSL